MACTAIVRLWIIQKAEVGEDIRIDGTLEQARSKEEV